MNTPHLPETASTRARRLVAMVACTLLAYALALNLLWEMWSETGTVGVAMNLSMALFDVPGRWVVYMALPWAHVAVAVVSCAWLYLTLVGKQARATPATRGEEGGGGGFFFAWGLLTMAVTCSFAGLKYLGERQIEAAGGGQPARELSVAEVTDGGRLDAPARLRAGPRPDDVLTSWPLHRKTTAKLTRCVPLAAEPDDGTPPRVVLHLEQPLNQPAQARDWAPPYAVQRMFAPVPTWVRGELARRGRPLAPGAVLVQRVWLDGEGRPQARSLSAHLDAMVVAGLGAFCGLLLIGLGFLMRNSTSPSAPA